MLVNYAFYIDLGDMAYETWYEMYRGLVGSEMCIRDRSKAKSYV